MIRVRYYIFFLMFSTLLFNILLIFPITICGKTMAEAPIISILLSNFIIGFVGLFIYLSAVSFNIVTFTIGSYIITIIGSVILYLSFKYKINYQQYSLMMIIRTIIENIKPIQSHWPFMVLILMLSYVNLVLIKTYKVIKSHIDKPVTKILSIASLMIMFSMIFIKELKVNQSVIPYVTIYNSFTSNTAKLID